MSAPQTEAVQHKIEVTRQTKEDVGGILYPAKDTGARMVWDAADAAAAAGKSSSDVIEHLTATTTMSAGTVSSQLTYWRKATGRTLAKRVSEEKAKKEAEKAEAKAKREADREAKRAAKEAAAAAKNIAKIDKLKADLAAAEKAKAELEAQGGEQQNAA